MKKSILLMLAAVMFLTSFLVFKGFLNSQKQNAVYASNVKKSKILPKDNGNDRNDKSGIIEMLKWRFKTLRDPKTNSIPYNIRNKELAFAETLPNSKAVQLKKAGKIISSSNWIFRGPNNQGGRTKGVAVDIADTNIVLAGAASGGIWRLDATNNLGWTETTDPSDIQSVDCLTQDTRPGKTNIWYYGTGEYQSNFNVPGISTYDLQTLLGNGIFKSTDNGKSWKVLPSTQSNSPASFVNKFQIVWDIVVDTTVHNQDILFAACAGGVFKSTDGGNTWMTILNNIDNLGNLGLYSDVAISADGSIFATVGGGDSAGVYYSSDGTNFQNITPNDWPFNITRIVLTTAPSNKNILYMLANTPGVGQAGAPDGKAGDYNSLWRYNVSTNQWTNLSDKLPTWSGNVGGYSSQGGYDMAIKVKPDDENFVVIGGTNIYRTTDGFATQLDSTDWIGGYSTKNDISLYPGSHSDQHAFYFVPSNTKTFISGNDGGISFTNDVTANPVVWKMGDETYNTSQFWSVSLDHGLSGDPFLVCGMQDNGSMMDTSGAEKSNWIVVGSGDGTISAVADSANLFYYSSQNGNVTMQDRNQDWTTVTPANATGFMFITPYILDPNNTNVMFLAAGSRLWRNSNLTQIPWFSNDNTTINWSVFTDSAQTNISALAMCKSVPGLLYIGTDAGKLYKINSAGNTDSKFVDITGTNFPTGAYLGSIAVDPNDGNNVMVCFTNYNVLSVFYSSDGGTTWNSVSGNLEQNTDGSGNGPAVQCVKILPVGGTNIYLAGTTTGLYMTSNLDGSNTQWVKQAPDAIGNVIVTTIDSRASDGTVVVGTFGKGAFSSVMSVTGVNENKSEPYQYALSQNYPNPFNPSTTIQYSLQKSGLVSLKIYDSIGRLVKTIVNGYQAEGEHKVVFNTNALSVASGIYFYRLKTDNFSSTKKMILLK